MKRQFVNSPSKKTKRHKNSEGKSKKSPRNKKSPKTSDELEEINLLIEEDFDSLSPKTSDELEELNLLIEEDFESPKPNKLKLKIQDDDFSDIVTPKSSPKQFFTETPLSLSKFISPSFRLPSTPFWSKYELPYQYNQTIDICFSYFVNKYKNKVKTCVTEGIDVIIEENHKEITVNPYVGFHKSLRKCIRNKSEFVIIPLAISYFDSFGDVSGHKCLVIVNNILKTVEYFDPNGAQYHIDKYDNKDYHALNNFLVDFKDYKKLSFDVSCPRFGFQAYESLAEKGEKDLRGYCAIWAWFITDLRLKYPYYEPMIIQEKYMDYIFEKYGDNTKNYLRNFIVRYANYIYSKVKPKTPTFIKNYEAEYEYVF